MELGGPITEARHEQAADLDLRSTRDLVELMNDEDASVAAVVDAVTERLRAGGRLIHVGAGTSVRVAALDADECAATFGVEPGGVSALCALDPAAEDDAATGACAARAAAVGPGHSVVLVSASGRTPFVVGAAEAAAAGTPFVVGADGSALARLCAYEISVVVGPELVAGSTRLEAGTAQKLVLHTISTVATTRLGKT